MDNNCANCKHWDKQQDGTPADDRTDSHCGQGTKRCGAIVRFAKAFVWEWPEDDDDAEDMVLIKSTPGPAAFAHDASDYMAFVTTTPDFYCNKWIQK